MSLLETLHDKLNSYVADDVNTSTADYASILKDLPPHNRVDNAAVLVGLVKQKLSKEPSDDRELLVRCH